MTNRKYAILSDIHGNYEALTRVKDDIEKEGVDRIICLGDTMGYGPNQEECYEDAKDFYVHICGNHEVLTKFQLKHMDAELNASAFKISYSASIAIKYFAEKLMGKKQIKSSITGEFFELPEEKLETLISDEYDTILAEMILQKISKEINIETPKSGGWGKIFGQKLTKDIQDKITYSSLSQLFLKHPEFMDEYYERIKRAEKVKKIHTFLKGGENKYSYKKGNALFVHDDPLEPGSMKYFFDVKTGKKAELSTRNRVYTELIRPSKFEGTEYIFVGHTHVLPNVVEMNGMNVVYVGSVGIPRRDNVKQKYACYTIATFDENNNVVDVKGKRLIYFWQKTQRKMIEAGLVDKFGALHVNKKKKKKPKDEDLDQLMNDMRNLTRGTKKNES